MWPPALDLLLESRCQRPKWIVGTIANEVPLTCWYDTLKASFCAPRLSQKDSWETMESMWVRMEVG